jgi:hypothetical protein
MHPQQCFLNQNKRTNQSIHIGLYQQLVVTHVPHLYRKMGRLATTVWGLSLPRCVCVRECDGEGGGRAGGGQYCYFILFFTSLFIY